MPDPGSSNQVPDFEISRALLALLTVAGAAALVVLFWIEIGGNAAGWLTTPVVGGAILAVDLLVEGERRYRSSSSRARHAILFLTFAIAIAGSAAYIIWPGTLGWYLIGVCAFPVCWVLYWARDPNQAAGSGDFADGGPFTAP